MSQIRGITVWIQIYMIFRLPHRNSIIQSNEKCDIPLLRNIKLIFSHNVSRNQSRIDNNRPRVSCKNNFHDILLIVKIE